MSWAGKPGRFGLLAKIARAEGAALWRHKWCRVLTDQGGECFDWRGRQGMESPDCQFGRPELLSGILGESEEGKGESDLHLWKEVGGEGRENW